MTRRLPSVLNEYFADGITNVRLFTSPIFLYGIFSLNKTDMGHWAYVTITEAQKSFFPYFTVHAITFTCSAFSA
jgi:hypothetical protein